MSRLSRHSSTLRTLSEIRTELDEASLGEFHTRRPGYLIFRDAVSTRLESGLP